MTSLGLGKEALVHEFSHIASCAVCVFSSFSLSYSVALVFEITVD